MRIPLCLGTSSRNGSFQEQLRSGPGGTNYPDYGQVDGRFSGELRKKLIRRDANRAANLNGYSWRFNVRILSHLGTRICRFRDSKEPFSPGREREVATTNLPTEKPEVLAFQSLLVAKTRQTLFSGSLPSPLLSDPSLGPSIRLCRCLTASHQPTYDLDNNSYETWPRQ